MHDKKRISVACDIMKQHKVNITIMTMWCVQACGLNSLVVYFNVKTHNIYEASVTTRSEV